MFSISHEWNENHGSPFSRSIFNFDSPFLYTYLLRTTVFTIMTMHTKIGKTSSTKKNNWWKCVNDRDPQTLKVEGLCSNNSSYSCKLTLKTPQKPTTEKFTKPTSMKLQLLKLHSQTTMLKCTRNGVMIIIPGQMEHKHELQPGQLNIWLQYY